MAPIRFVAASLALLWATCAFVAAAGEPLRAQIDAAIGAAHAGPVADRSSDAEFLRRVYLDLAGTIPPADEARRFLADEAANKRAQLVDKLLASPEYAARMQQAFSVMLLERREGTTVPPAEWDRYLRESFAANKPWDQMAREILASEGVEEDSRPAMKFFLTRGAGSYDLLTRDVGRLLLGIDLQCAQCHDHPNVNDYKQAHYFGLYAFLNQSYLYRDRQTQTAFFAEKPPGDKVEFKSVFTGEAAQTGPRLPGGEEIVPPTFAKGEELLSPPQDGKPGVPRFRLRQRLAEELCSGDNGLFTRNIANRLWFLMIGRGLVWPLDLHHRDNPPSHPELMDCLAEAFVDMKFDVRAFLRELALSETYQRSSLLPAGVDEVPADSYALAELKPLSAEQLFAAALQATGQAQFLQAEIDEELRGEDPRYFDILQANAALLAAAREEKRRERLEAFVEAFANPPGEPETEFNPSLAGALFLSNDELLLAWLEPKPGNLLDRLLKLDDPAAVAEELYLSVLSRPPDAEERAEVAAHLQQRDDRQAALRELAWALLACSEFRLNH